MRSRSSDTASALTGAAGMNVYTLDPTQFTSTIIVLLLPRYVYLNRFTRPFCSIRIETVVHLGRAIETIYIGGYIDRCPLSRGRTMDPTVTMSNVMSIHLWWSCRLWLSFTTRPAEAHTNPPSKDPSMQVRFVVERMECGRGRWGIGSPELQETHRRKCNAGRQHESDL